MNSDEGLLFTVQALTPSTDSKHPPTDPKHPPNLCFYGRICTATPRILARPQDLEHSGGKNRVATPAASRISRE